MVEVLMNYRTFLYRRIPMSGNQVRWELIRQIMDFPSELQTDAGNLAMFSPCFTKYIVTDKQTK